MQYTFPLSRVSQMSRVASLLLLTGLLTAGARAQVNVYVMSSSNAVADNALVNMLSSYGHNVILGVSYSAFNGTQSLTGINTVYFQCNYNWTDSDMPLAGQTALSNFVNSGGGMVTSEWALWDTVSQGKFTTLAPLFPVVPTATFSSPSTGVFTQTTANMVLNAGLPSSFSTPLESISGTATHFTTLRLGAVSFYDNNGFIGLAGGSFGAGRVMNFNTVNAQQQVANQDFGRLLSNSMNWSAGNITVASAPEPGTCALLVSGLLGLWGIVVRRKG
jgi:hypothetical protein